MMTLHSDWSEKLTRLSAAGRAEPLGRECLSRFLDRDVSAAGRASPLRRHDFSVLAGRAEPFRCVAGRAEPRTLTAGRAEPKAGNSSTSTLLDKTSAAWSLGLVTGRAESLVDGLFSLVLHAAESTTSLLTDSGEPMQQGMKTHAISSPDGPCEN